MEAQYRTLDEVPEWGRDTVRYLLAKNYLRRQEDGTLPLNDTLLNALVINDLLRVLVINDRAGLYDL